MRSRGLDHPLHGCSNIGGRYHHTIFPGLSVCSFTSTKKPRSSLIPLRSVFTLTRNVPVVGVIGLLSFLAFIFGVYAAVRSGIINE